ncbi:hypothetical protein AnigIFM59636_000940 [Aspergillus niger]|nr:hypothetical protein AnigIFM59636_000940 [Aspergillus niger]
MSDRTGSTNNNNNNNKKSEGSGGAQITEAQASFITTPRNINQLNTWGQSARNRRQGNKEEFDSKGPSDSSR